MGRSGYMKVIFFGTSKYCLPVLETLKASFDLKMIVTREDKPVGRKKVLTPSATKLWAIEHKIPVTSDYIQIPDCDLAIVADYGKIIPEEIFTKPKLGTFNIHFSKLPDLRGASPVQYTLLRGDTDAWITVFKIEKTLDTGPILWQHSFPINPDDTTQTLYIRLFKEAAKILPTLNFAGKLTPQNHSKATFTKLLTKADGFVKYEDILNSHLSTLIYNHYRAMTPWPGLWTIKNGKRMIIRNCHLEGEKLILDKIQFEGKTATTL